MANRDTSSARRFHDLTKYIWVEEEGQVKAYMGEPPDLHQAMGDQLKENEPLPYKNYLTLDPIPLPTDFDDAPVPGLTSIAANGEVDVAEAVPSLADIARICLLSNGILKRGSHGTGRVIEYRAAGGTGARYHLELYLVCGDLPGLAAGVYHYAANDHALRQLRAGDFRSVLVEATGAEPAVASAPATMVVTSTFWRNGWRYLNRAYRHAYWDMGTTLVNVLAVSASNQLPTKLVFGYVDEQVNHLIGVDGVKEAALSMVTLGRTSEPAPSSPDVPVIDHPTEPLSAWEIEFPDIYEAHRNSSLLTGDEVAEWRSAPLVLRHPEPTGKLINLEPVDLADLDTRSIDDIIRRRRSVRHYDVDKPAPFAAFSTLLALSSQGVVSDVLDHTAPLLNGRYLIVNNVEGVEPGAYVHHPELGAIEQLRAGNFRKDAAILASGQEYAANAHVNFYSLVDLDAVLEHYGNRGYRIVQTEGALFASKLHLAAHAVGLGAVGSTSRDNMVIDFFSPHAAGKAYMFILTFGVRRRRTG
jgi:SagB-type dehydrogenase family enzyme